MKQTISVIVPTLDRPGALSRCLASLREQTALPCEVIVVDNSPGGEAVVPVIGGLAITTIREPRPGVWHARNRGAAAARGGIIAFIDDDAAARPDWLARISACIEETGAAGVGGPTFPVWQSRPPAWIERSQKALSYLGVFSLGGERRRVEGFRDFLIGANCAFRREIFEEGRGFPEMRWGRGAGAEDLQFSREVAAAYPVIYDPCIVVDHFVPSGRMTMSYLAGIGFDYGMKKTLIGRPLSPRGMRDLWGIDGWISAFSFAGYCAGLARKGFERVGF